MHGEQLRRKGGSVDNRDSMLGMMPVVYRWMRHVTLEPRTVQRSIGTRGYMFTKVA